MKLNKTDCAAFVRAVMQDVPHTDYQEQVQWTVDNYFAARCPADVVAFAKKYPGRLRSYFVSHTDSAHTPFVEQPQYNIESNHPELYRAVRVILDKKAEQQRQRDELRNKVAGMIAGCTTLKQARERLPEFEKYLPKERDPATTAGVPVSNVVAELTKAGWSKGEKG